ncbi:permease domain protein [Oscillochloris trichoides DG-6]|uniref:Permease domain protein n=1 Tax=Oscillochloris trichoides DG-6 TaxID=765420 RepID=E1ID60_9CHLR|nr:ABC transporter permease [Oscillochloris trichoides]EFO80892.1 permease domain protein [Oscillochloris trichoides DG-6]
MLPFYLALKEMLRNKRRFAVIFLIVAMITLLVLFTAALGDGLALGASEYFDRMGSDLIVFQEDVDYQLLASRLARTRLNQLRRIPGIEAVGPIGVSSTTITAINNEASENIDVALIGVEPSQPGAPNVYAGEALGDSRAAEVVLDRHVIARLNIPIGAMITIKVVQGMEEQFYDLRVIGYAEGRKINYVPSIFVPLKRWERIRPQENPGIDDGDLIFNVAAVQLDQTSPTAVVAAEIERSVSQVDVTDPVTAYTSTQGYNDMISTISMQQGFMLLIVVLIVGSFFQIQTLQKVAQIGMLEAIGASSRLVIMTLLIQVMITMVLGLLIGGSIVWLMAQVLPASVPIVFSGSKISITIVALFASGPIASLVSARTILKIEPLRALGLGG